MSIFGIQELNMEILEKKTPKLLVSAIDNPRKVFSKFATGVCVVLLHLDDGSYHGLTINSFSSLSLEPTLVSFSIKIASQFYSLIDSYSKKISINVLSAKQIDLAKTCAKRGGGYIDENQINFNSEDYYLDESIACFIVKISSCVKGGDHMLYIAEVCSLLLRDDSNPLVFFNGKFSTMGTEI
jgi:flavin reductase (DIM6/NTAB) family NADH-FMN oxidoreductase RutF